MFWNIQFWLSKFLIKICGKPTVTKAYTCMRNGIREELKIDEIKKLQDLFFRLESSKKTLFQTRTLEQKS